MEQQAGNNPYQIIFYGAPGTGKSYLIKKQLKAMNVPKENIFRTTFHPDSDYSSFVGTYKPTMKPVIDKYKEIVGKDEEIAYSFIPQTFVKAYVQAYKKPDENVYLIIEEINRGNAPAIFGEIFQLLDRNEKGTSEYGISNYEVANEVYKNSNHPDKIPSNLTVLATMNTSDQNVFTLDTAQIKGVDSTVRENNVYLEANSKLYVIEKLMTHGNQEATSNMMVEMNGEGSSAQIVSRSVAKGSSRQIFHPRAVGKNLCHAHVQCDSIIMDHAEVSSIPEINAKHVDAAIIHEAAIGRINDEQLVKLRTLGMTEEEAEGVIIENFLN